MNQVRTSASDIQTLVEVGRGEGRGGVLWSRGDAETALREAHGDVGQAMVLLAGRTPPLQAGPPGGTRGRRGSPGGRSRRSPPRQVGTQASATTPYAKAVMTESAKRGLSYLLPAPVGTMVTQMIDLYLKGSDDSEVEDIKRRVEIIERHVGIARIKKNKSKKKKNKSKRKSKRKKK